MDNCKKYHFILLLIILFTSPFVNAQQLEKIKANNTVFIYFENDQKVETKTTLGSHEINPDRKAYLYKIYHFNTEGIKYKMPLLTLHFRVNKNISKQKESTIFRLNKSFLRKNKKLIIDSKFIKKIGSQKTLDLLRDAKTIFLIDKEQNTKKTILLKEVQLILPQIE